MSTLIPACHWASPTGIGLDEDSLKPCPDSSNCVSSYETDSHGIEPLKYRGESDAVRRELISILKKRFGATVKQASDTYVYATVTTTLGFVDDLQFRFVPSAKIIHVRSASRVGYSDMGTNRYRIGVIRKALNNNKFGGT